MFIRVDMSAAESRDAPEQLNERDHERDARDPEPQPAFGEPRRDHDARHAQRPDGEVGGGRDAGGGSGAGGSRTSLS